MNPFIRFFHKNANVFGALLIAVGILVGYFGKLLFKPAICLVGTIGTVIVLSLLFFSMFFNRDTKNYIGWLVFAGSLLIGCVVGLILAKLSRIGVDILSGWGGFCLGLILYNAFMYKIDNIDSLVFWIFNITLGLLCGFAGLFLFHHALIISTSVFGSYALMRGISFYAGGFPDEMELYNYLKYNVISEIDPRFYGYMAGFFVNSLICIILQYKLWNKDKNELHKHPYHLQN